MPFEEKYFRADLKAIGKEAEIEGGNLMLYKLVSKGKISVKDGAEEAGVSEELFLKNMKDAGYKMPTTAQMFEKYYDKPFDEITQADLGSGEEINWGEDVGGEVIKTQSVVDKYAGFAAGLNVSSENVRDERLK